MQVYCTLILSNTSACFPSHASIQRECPGGLNNSRRGRVYIIFQDTCSFLFKTKLTSLEMRVTSRKRVVIQTEAALFDIITCFWKKLPNTLLILISLNMLNLFLLYLFKCTSHFHMFFCFPCTQFACLVYEFFDCQLFLRCCPYNLMITVLTLSWFPLKYSTVSLGFINDA